MKTSDLVALMLALVISLSGFAGIDLLFTQASGGQTQTSAPALRA